ncbi:hypothetical protein DS909_09760 [Phaeobacter gallaeciensis]|uniref:Membrane fusion protein (MFP) family protein n=2 Tax=Roseobacteraceae TaxID=2854170 RepID=A0A366X463_9RHOB|nr:MULTISPECIES: HlyD family type I secretion periplasmic adaptor subunit [Roseobacteraceae]MBT3140007.1 HlyD family type I secretion periplasmic adaptor subunit [Falsiruegeria litorea]MBT8169460.1 HlyD family type I secretion periplasmic adaptor subunit [Falsiruegeria litorea]RBW55908.1 hypothetical protein DS909_09760 [Phaeobacter gallaeciensis]
MSNQYGDHDFELSETAGAKWARRSAMVLVVGLAILIFWMVRTSIDEVTKARGAIEPIANVQRVESFAGGQVKSVLVTPGQKVQVGDLLVTLDQTEALSDLKNIRSKSAALSLEIERLTSLVERREPDFSKFEEDFAELVTREAAALDAQLAFLEAERSVTRSQIVEKKAELAAIEAELPELMSELRIANDERAIQEDLFNRKLAPRTRLAELNTQVAQYRFELARLAGRQSVTEAEIGELEHSIERINLEETAKARSRIVDAITERRTLSEQAAKLNKRLSETEVVAPVAGVVQAIPDEKTGDVIEAGGVVAVLVPLDGGLHFVGSITPRDVAFVEVGQSVRLKVDSFDFSRYGALQGTVTEISPTTRIDQRGNAFYDLEISLQSTTISQTANDGLDVLPGMTGEADIRTGTKTVFEYVWKPIYTNLDLALSER